VAVAAPGFESRSELDTNLQRYLRQPSLTRVRVCAPYSGRGASAEMCIPKNRRSSPICFLAALGAMQHARRRFPPPWGTLGGLPWGEPGPTCPGAARSGRDRACHGMVRRGAGAAASRSAGACGRAPPAADPEVTEYCAAQAPGQPKAPSAGQVQPSAWPASSAKGLSPTRAVAKARHWQTDTR
jgi:hypothetical protein